MILDKLLSKFCTLNYFIFVIHRTPESQIATPSLNRVKQPRLVAEDATVTVEEVGKVTEDATVPRPYLCQVRHQKSGPARTLKETFLPLALETRARMKICSALPCRRWRCTYVRSSVPMLPKSEQVVNIPFFKSQPICR